MVGLCQKKRVRSHANSTCKPPTPPPLASFFSSSLASIVSFASALPPASIPASNQKAAASTSPLDALQLPPGTRISSETTPPARHRDWPNPRGTRGPILGPLQGPQVLMSLCPHAVGPIRAPDACDERKPLQSLGGNQRYGICCCQGPGLFSRPAFFFPISRHPWSENVSIKLLACRVAILKQHPCASAAARQKLDFDFDSISI